MRPIILAATLPMPLLQSSAAMAVLAATTIAAPSAKIETAATLVGKEVRLGFYATFKQDCSAGPLPKFELSGPLTNGSIVVRQGTMKTSRVKGCAAISAPAIIVFYHPHRGFTGTDAISFVIRDPASGLTESHSFNVLVTAPI